MDRAALVEYIRNAAVSRGIDPDVAVKVAESEGLNANPEEGWQSTIVKNGKREESYGPFQLYMGGGLGNVFQERTGLDPRDPSTVSAQVDFALDEAVKTGWGPWYGARRVGLSTRAGLPDSTGKVSSAGTTASETLMNGSPSTSYDAFGDAYPDSASRNAAETLMLDKSTAANKAQADNNSSLDDLMDAMEYLDLSEMSGGAEKATDLGTRITPGRAGGGARALKRLGLASLVQ